MPTPCLTWRGLSQCLLVKSPRSGGECRKRGQRAAATFQAQMSLPSGPSRCLFGASVFYRCGSGQKNETWGRRRRPGLRLRWVIRRRRLGLERGPGCPSEIEIELCIVGKYRCIFYHYPIGKPEMPGVWLHKHDGIRQTVVAASGTHHYVSCMEHECEKGRKWIR